MKNQVIEALTPEHGEKVIKYWKSQGVDTGPFRGIMNKAERNYCRYYGVTNGKFASYSLRQVEATGAEIIKLSEDCTIPIF